MPRPSRMTVAAKEPRSFARLMGRILARTAGQKPERRVSLGGVGIARDVGVEERHVLGEPERMEAGRLRRRRGDGEHLAESERVAGERDEYAELHAVGE